MIALVFLPALIYFIRSPFRPSHADILGALVGIWIGLTVLIYLGNWLFPRQGGYWAASIGWIAMCAYAWRNSNAERAHYDRRSSSESRTKQ